MLGILTHFDRRPCRLNASTPATDTAIRVVGLSKRYRRVGGLLPARAGDGPAAASYRTLREALVDLVRTPFRKDGEPRPEEFYALRDLAFEVPAGSVVGIIGRNGAGKTTLLKILSRITEPSAGFAEIRGRVGSLLEIGTGFHPELTGRENIFLSGAVLGMKRSEIVRRFDEIAAFAEVAPFLEVPLKRYSSGMYLRLAFAVAAHLDTEILLVDEVLAVGDLEFRQRCLGKMREVGRGGRTVLYVSHDMSSVRQLCERAIWLDSGRIVADGPAADVTARYEAQAYARADTSGGVYLRSPGETRGKAIWVSRVDLRNDAGFHCTSFRWGETLHLVITLDGEAPADGFTIDWSIQNQRGEQVAFGTANPQQDIYFDRTDRAVECAIGPLPLCSGEYRISLYVWVWHQVRWDTWDGAASFQVVLADAFGTGFDSDAASYGSVVIPHRWRKLAKRDITSAG